MNLEPLIHWLFDHPALFALTGLALGFITWLPRRGALRLTLMAILAAVPLALFLISGLQDGCLLSGGKEGCFGFAMGLVVTVVMATPMWIATLGLGAMARRLLRSRKRP